MVNEISEGEAHPILDRLINATTNASAGNRILTDDGNEQTLQVTTSRPTC